MRCGKLDASPLRSPGPFDCHVVFGSLPASISIPSLHPFHALRAKALTVTTMAEHVVRAMIDLYETMARMCGGQRLDIIFAPEGGHLLPSDLVAELELRKTPAAIDLIRRMPYISGLQHILPYSEAINYMSEDSMKLYEPPRAWRPVKYENTDMELRSSSDPLGDSIVKPCEVPVTTVSIPSKSGSRCRALMSTHICSTTTRLVRSS